MTELLLVWHFHFPQTKLCSIYQLCKDSQGEDAHTWYRCSRKNSSHRNPIVGKQIILMAHLKPSIFKEFNFPFCIQQYHFFFHICCKDPRLKILPAKVLQIRHMCHKKSWSNKTVWSKSFCQWILYRSLSCLYIHLFWWTYRLITVDQNYDYYSFHVLLWLQWV